jgi:hypothetical protein
MHLLADYAHRSGYTVLVITHTLNTIDVCDEVLFIENARLRETGKRQEVLNALEADIDDQPLQKTSFYQWANIFQHFQTDDEKRKKCTLRIGIQRSSPKSLHFKSRSTQWFIQFRCLLQRYLHIRLGDTWSFIGTLFAGMSGLLFFILPNQTFVRPSDNGEIGIALANARQSVYVVSLVVALLGLITTYTEISKEFNIYRHERLKGLSPSAYFLSKWVWLALWVGVLAPVILLSFIVLVYRQPLPGYPTPSMGEEINLWQQLIAYQIPGLLTIRSSWLVLTTLVLSCIASVTVGLVISALAGDNDKGYLYLSFIAVFVVLFSGLLKNERLKDLIDSLSIFSTGRWTYEGFSSTLGIYCWSDSWHFDEFNSSGHLVSTWLALLGYTICSVLIAIVILRLRDPWYDTRWNLIALFQQEKAKLMLAISLLVLLMSFTVFLRQQSRDYHSLNYWSNVKYGGTGALVYPNVSKVSHLGFFQYWNGHISQSWCGN